MHHTPRFTARLPALVLMLSSVLAQAWAAGPDAFSSDPRAQGVMQGFPPPPDKLIRFGDGSSNRFPGLRWSLNHMRELVPTANVWRGESPAIALPQALRELDGVAATTLDGRQITFAQFPALTYADGLLVLHKGAVVYEKYFGEGAPHRPHLGYSITKSFVGTLAATLAARGRLDPQAPVTRYVPELSSSAYGDATVRQVMDMTAGVRFSENYTDVNSDVRVYARAGGVGPRPPGHAGPSTFYEYLATVQAEGAHGDAFAYKTVNTEVLAWVLRRASGMPLAELLSTEIWQKLGVENDAYFMVDSIGTEWGGAGLSTTLRDLARFGEMIRNNGRFNGRQIIPPEAIADILRGGDAAKFAKAGLKDRQGWSYRNMWWMTHNANGAFMARGMHGQVLYIDPKAEMVVVRHASPPQPAGDDPVTQPVLDALAQALEKQRQAPASSFIQTP